SRYKIRKVKVAKSCARRGSSFLNSSNLVAEQTRQVDRVLRLADRAGLAEELDAPRLRVHDPHLNRAHGEITRDFLFQLPARIGRRHDLYADLGRSAERSLRAMPAHELTARPRSVGDHHPVGGQHRSV